MKIEIINLMDNFSCFVIYDVYDYVDLHKNI